MHKNSKSPDNKLAALLAKQANIATQITAQRQALAAREKRARQERAIELGELADAAGLAEIDREILQKEFAAIAARHCSPAAPASSGSTATTEEKTPPTEPTH